MKTYYEAGYQGITYKDSQSQRTPIYENPTLLINHLDFAKSNNLIDRYIIQYVKSKNVILSDVEVEAYRYIERSDF